MKSEKNRIIYILALFACLGVFGFWLLNDVENAPAFAVRLPALYADSLEVSSGQNLMSIRPLSALAAAGERESGKIVYREAYAMTDIEQTIFENKIKEDIILKESGHPEEFSYQLNLTGLSYEIDEQGNIVFKKTNSDEHETNVNESILDKVFIIPAPFLIDALGKRSETGAVKTVIEDGVLRLTPDPAWLAAHPYPIVLDPTIELAVLNVHSHPLEGDDWIVSFTTAGQADLTISPNDQATIDDDEFVSLWCGQEERSPEIRTGDVIFYKGWECGEIGRVVHKTLKAGDHILKFEFGGEIDYAYNSYSVNRKYAWSENAGWLNASSTHEQVVVSSEGLTGYMWGENIGWIKFDYDGTPGATNTTATDWGVTNDGAGNLGGYAWGENIGWINFHPTHSQVIIDYDSGEFTGSAWGENIGWINFGHSQTNYSMTYELPPLVSTQAVSNVGSKVITANAHTFDGGLVVTERGFYYGLTETDTWSIVQPGTFTSGNFTAVINNLSPGTAYYIRAYAVNEVGTTYGEYVPFTTESEHTSQPIIIKEGVIFNEGFILK